MTPRCSFVGLAALCLSGVCAISGADETYGQQDAPLAAVVLGVEIHTDNPDEMQYVILRKLTDRYATDRGIEVKPEEIDAYIARLVQGIEQDRKEDEARREEIVRKLRSKDLPEDERKRLTVQLDTLNELLVARSATTDDAAADSGEDKAAREQVASSFVRQRKINRALYEQYGGRIVFQQGGSEPLDAYKKFLQEQQKLGAFEILKKGLEPAFWKYYVTDSIHSFHRAGSEEEAQVFRTPWWLSD